MSGVLQNSGRARVVGQTTLGNVEILWGYDFDDSSRVWLAHETFQPVDLPNGIWEKTGIVPDVLVPTRWDLFSEATDPALAKAVELLSQP
jgi:C-terminal processing protease CtpA/Prc